MYSKTYCQAFDAWQLPLKIWKMMGSPALLLLVCFQASLSGNAQEVSLSVKNAPLQEVFEKINQQTGAEFLYNFQMLKTAKPVTLDVTDMALPAVLALCFKDQPLTYIMDEKTIIVRPGNEENLTAAKKPQQAGAQNRILSGTVVDDVGSPLAGATVRIQGTNVGIITDTAGKYRLRIPQVLMDEGKALVLEVSFVGFDDEAVEIGNRGVIDFVLLPSIEALMEVAVVSTGYYEVEQRLNPGNIAKIDAQIIEQQPISNPLQALQGRLTGVNIRQRTGVPGSAFDIQIRGLNSLRDDGNNPLYLINGVPYPAQSSRPSPGGSSVGGSINPLNFINPNDIESIEILKDADATAIYGSRGANGVVRITTKQGRSDRFQVDYNGSLGVGTVENKLDVLNTEQYLTMRREAFANDGTSPEPADFDLNGTWSENRETDWQEELLGGTANFSNHQLSFSGGANNTTFLVGLNYTRQSTVYSDDLFDRKISGNLNLNHTSHDNRFTLGLSGIFTANNNNITSLNFASQAISLAPNAPALRNEDESLNWEGGSFDNPLAQLLQERETRTVNLSSSLNISYEILEGLRVMSVVGYNELQSELFIARPMASFNPFLDNLTGGSIFGNNSVNTWTVEPQLEYNKLVEKHEITALAGATFQETISNRENFEALGFTSDALLRNPLAADRINVTSKDNSEYRFNSLYGRLNYLYDDKYILNLTGRRDGSSRFGPGRQFANFGAIGLAWIFSEEDFVSNNLGFLSYGKLRGSFGVTGSDAIGDYQFLELWIPADFGYDDIQGLTPGNLFNEDFAWEETIKAEIGLELGLINDKIRLNTSYFKNNSSNQLVGQPLPGTTGFVSVQSNFPAEVENRGLEIELNTTNINRGSFRWTSSFNISFLRNEVVSFENLEESSFVGEVEVGEPLSVSFLFDYTGVDPETGIATFRIPSGGDFVTTPGDLLPFGNQVQDYFGGLQNTISYKGLSLDFHFRFVEQVGIDPIGYFAVPGQFSNQPTYVMARWQNPGDITNVPKFTQSGLTRSLNARIRSSDGRYTDASFIRLQNVRLSYQFSENLIRRYSLNSLTLFIQGQNLLTFTDYRGWDPETQSTSLPPLRIITGGISVSL